MTQDVIALTPKMPEIRILLAGLYAGGPELRVDSVSEGAAIRLCASDGRPVATVEVPLFLQVPGEISRLLGAGVRAEAPTWWTEVRAATAFEEAGRLAGSVAGRLTTVLGGTTWPAEAAHTDVVPIPSHGGEAPVGAGDPLDVDLDLDVDVLTGQAAVVIQDRPVVAATTWLTELLRTTARSGRELQIVTPPGARLTLPVRTLLVSVPARWVVRDPECGYYDGLSGAVLRWHEGRFAPVPATQDGRIPVAEAFLAGVAGVAKATETTETADTAEGSEAPGAAAPHGQQQLHLSLRTTHPADEHLVLGGALEAAWQALTGAPPAGWATAEPVNLPWAPRQLTELARARAQKSAPTWLVAVGAPDRPTIATLRIVRTQAGVEEQITLAVGYAPGRLPPLDALPELAETLVTRHHLASMLTQLRPARADLTTPSHFEAPPVPLSFTLGPDAVRTVGRARAESAPDMRPIPLGVAARPALHYSLGDGTDPVAWQRLKSLDHHLKADR
ncbi:DUF6177 family protein [Streptomyces avermitilis]